MSGVVKLQRPAQAFELIPRGLVQHPYVSQDGKFLAIWLACKPPNWIIQTAALRCELGWTKERFGKATRSLASCGLWRHVRIHQLHGQFEHIYTCMLEPEAGFPASGEPGAGKPDAGNPACIHNTRKIDTREKQQPRAERATVVVFSSDLEERGLLSAEERARVALELAAQEAGRAQELADELAGALRARGRVGERGIRNPVRFAAALTHAPNTNLSYAAEEAALRFARASSASFAQQAQAEARPAAPMPKAARDLAQRLRLERRGMSK